VVPVKDAAPALISNGYDEAVQFNLSSDFVINAEEDGKVIDVNKDMGFIVVQYKSGKTQAITTNPEIVKNSSSAFFLANNLTLVNTKVGQTFKKDEPLAYHDKYFKYSKMNGLRYAIGPICKVAFMSTYNTYEDAGICTEQLSERMSTLIVYQELGKFKRHNNILDMVKIGDHVNIGDSLIKFDASVQDDALNDYLNKLNDQNAELLKEETRNDIKAHHAGKVIDIKVYSLLQPEQLSPSLGNIVQSYFDKGTAKKEYLSQFDSGDSDVYKAGYFIKDSTEPVKDKYNSIKGNKGIDVLIEIYIEHSDVMGVGDKVALYGPNKQIISEVIPKGYEPYSEFRPDEEISVLTSPGTIARRMTGSSLAISAAMKVMIELKRKIKDEIKFK
jgi:DNA-directed RNA polymerase beta subunit